MEHDEQDLNEISLIEDNEEDVHYLSETDDFYLDDFLDLNFASSRKRRNADGKFKSSSELSEGINERKREAAKRQCKEIQLSTIFVRNPHAQLHQ